MKRFRIYDTYEPLTQSKKWHIYDLLYNKSIGTYDTKEEAKKELKSWF